MSPEPTALPAHVVLAEALRPLPLPATPAWPGGVWDREVLRSGPISLTLFAPQGADHQSTHDRDELYVIVRGSGRFERDGEVLAYAPGDVLTVPAHVPHRFLEPLVDLQTWVVFWDA